MKERICIAVRRVWRFIRWPLAVVLVLYIGLVIYRIPAVREQDKTAKAVTYIHAQKITLTDVLGNNLPPPPNEEKNNATVEGIDANGNGIRDDVELAIFKLHPDSARVRAAELQYALALQMELTQVFNSETLVSTIQQEGRASLCIGDTTPEIKSQDTPEQIRLVLNLGTLRQKEVNDLILNTGLRNQTYKQILTKYMTSYGGSEGPHCDIDLQKLQN